jgi:hypothetical protein
MKNRLLVAFVAAALGVSPLQAQDAGRAPLSRALQEAARAEGIEIAVAPHLADDPVSRSARGGIEHLLAGYNFASIRGGDGRLQRIVVSGRNGDGASAPERTAESAPRAELLNLRPAPARLPEKFKHLSAGAVYAIDLPSARLKAMKKGERIALSLPDGQFSAVHDNRFEHDNGDVTWVGRLDGQGDDYRVIVTLGQAGAIGRIVTPNGAYNLELEEGAEWLVDIDASGLAHGGSEDDGLDGGMAVGQESPMAGGSARTPSARISTPRAATSAGTATSAFSGPTIDLMILYTPGMGAKAGFDTRLNYIVAVANQGYIDSGINLRLRTVAKRLVNYADANANQTALNELTNGQGAFASVPAWRQQYGADLVALLRPFNYAKQGNCGQAWVNGAAGSALNPALGFSVVGDGSDAATRYYCTDYSLAHELGHNLGSVHDRAHASFPGKHAYSYGYGVYGKFGTVMSYINPVVGKFSNPNLSCSGEPCGKPENAADSAYNALSINSTAAEIAGFMMQTAQ